MTDLKNMSVDELRDEMCVYCATDHQIAPFDEMARRLRELEQETQELKDHLDLMMDEFQRISALAFQNTEIKGLCERAIFNTKQKVSLIERTDQAESALLACQVREAELREAMSKAKPYLLHAPGMPSYIFTNYDDALSHSTGSKIMAVVEAAELLRHYWLLTKKSHIEHPQLDEWEKAWEKLDSALEAKHD